MGASESKETFQRQSSKKEKPVNVEEIRKSVHEIKTKIEENVQERENDSYFSILSRYSEKIQEVRRSKKKIKDIKRCEIVLGEINECIALLENKESSNCNSLDFGAIESNSFISQDVNKLMNKGDGQSNVEVRSKSNSLPEIKNKIRSLDLEIRRTVQMNDFKNLTILEKKVKVLYDDLELVQPMPHTPLQEEKEKLAANLIKYNNKILSLKKSEATDGLSQSKQQPLLPPKPTNQNDLMILIKIEQDLSDLEIKALTFDGTKLDNSYEELNSTLRENFIILDSLNLQVDEHRRRVGNARNLTKKILQELSRKVAENEESIRKEINAISVIEKEIAEYKIQVDNFRGGNDSSAYLKLDQNLRSVWAKLINVKGSFDKVKQYKENIIKDIQNLLKDLKEKDLQHQLEKNNQELLSKIEQFHNSWLGIQKVIKPADVSNNLPISNLLNNVYSSLKKILEESSRKPSVIYTNSSVIVEPLMSQTAEVDGKLQKTPSISGVFRKIQKIRNGIKNVDDKLKHFNGTTDSELYDDIEAELLKLKTDLESIEDNKNGTLSKAKAKATKELYHLTSKLQDRAEKNDIEKEKNVRTSVKRTSNLSTGRASIKSANASLEKIIKLDERVRKLEPEINNFKGVTDDKEFIEMRNLLNEYSQELHGLNVSRHENLNSSKLDVQDKIDMLQHLLTTIATGNEKRKNEAVNELKIILMRVQAIKGKIDSFTGTFKGIQYVHLEDDLKECLRKLEEIDNDNKKLTKSKESGKEKINNLLKILEERSLKSEENNSQQKIETARNKLLEVKRKMENFTGTSKNEEYYDILSELETCQGEITSIQKDRRQSINHSKVQYLNYIQDLLKYFDEKLVLNGQTQNSQKDIEEAEAISLINKSLLELKNLERKVEEVKEEVDMFHDSRNSKSYYELDDRISKLCLELDSISTYKNSDVKTKRRNLIQIVTECSKKLDEKTGDSPVKYQQLGVLQEIEKITEELKVINAEIDNFYGVKHDIEHTRLDESLIRLFLKLDNIDVFGDSTIKNAKMLAVKSIQESMAHLDRRVQDVVGTAV